MARVHVWVSGKVQGVFFRESARRTAQELNVSGWIRNLSDGRVEGVFEGTRDQLERAVAWCRKGPPSARVAGVEIREEPEEELRGFGIRPTA